MTTGQQQEVVMKKRHYCCAWDKRMCADCLQSRKQFFENVQQQVGAIQKLMNQKEELTQEQQLFAALMEKQQEFKDVIDAHVERRSPTSSKRQEGHKLTEVECINTLRLALQHHDKKEYYCHQTQTPSGECHQCLLTLFRKIGISLETWTQIIEHLDKTGMTMVDIKGQTSSHPHWVVLHKEKDAYNLHNPRGNGYCAFSCALKIAQCTNLIKEDDELRKADSVNEENLLKLLQIGLMSEAINQEEKADSAQERGTIDYWPQADEFDTTDTGLEVEGRAYRDMNRRLASRMYNKVNATNGAWISTWACCQGININGYVSTTRQWHNTRWIKERRTYMCVPDTWHGS